MSPMVSASGLTYAEAIVEKASALQTDVAKEGLETGVGTYGIPLRVYVEVDELGFVLVVRRL